MKNKYYLAMWGIDTNGNEYLLMETYDFDTKEEAIEFSKMLNVDVGCPYKIYLELCCAVYCEEECIDSYIIETLNREVNMNKEIIEFDLLSLKPREVTFNLNFCEHHLEANFEKELNDFGYRFTITTFDDEDFLTPTNYKFTVYSNIYGNHFSIDEDANFITLNEALNFINEKIKDLNYRIKDWLE